MTAHVGTLTAFDLGTGHSTVLVGHIERTDLPVLVATPHGDSNLHAGDTVLVYNGMIAGRVAT
jgi:hypothetical protein